MLIRPFPFIAMLAAILAGHVALADEARDVVQIGDLNEAYVQAFNRHDAAALGKLFVADGDYQILTGDLLQGTSAIVAGHASFFGNHAKVQLEGKSLKRKFLTRDIVLSHGRWKAAGGPPDVPSEGVWTAIQVRVDGLWRYETLRITVPLKP